MDLELKGRRAVVTGGSKGIGRAIAEGFAAEGANVSICARDGDEVAAAVASLKGKGVKAFGRAFDVADGPALTAWIASTAGELGGIDALVCNVSALAAGDSACSWENSFRTDMMHTVNAVAAAAPFLEKSAGGSIVLISSVSGFEVDFSAGSYGAIKAALIHYAKGLSRKLAAKGIRVNCVSPGNTYFDGGVWQAIEKNMPDLYDSTRKANPTGRFGTPAEVANGVVFISSPAAGRISGANLVIDGALTVAVRVALLGLILAAVCGKAAASQRRVEEDPVRLAWYTSLSANRAQRLAAEFGRLHPGIRVDLARPYLLFEPSGGTQAHWEKADVVTDPGIASRSELIGRGAFARLDFPVGRSSVLCPWVLGPRGDYAYTHALRVPLVFSLREVPGEDAPDSLAALAQPRWKGKVALLAPSASFGADCLYRFVVAHPALGFAWLERMRDNDVMLLFSRAALWEVMLSGVRPVIWGFPAFLRRSDRGSPGVGSRSARDASVIVLYATAINRRAPHPAAARLFVAWLLDPATQSFMSKNTLSYSLLKGVCERLERGPVCGGSLKASPAETEEFRRKVWKALLGDGHIPR